MTSIPTLKADHSVVVDPSGCDLALVNMSGYHCCCRFHTPSICRLWALVSASSSYCRFLFVGEGSGTHVEWSSEWQRWLRGLSALLCLVNLFLLLHKRASAPFPANIVSEVLQPSCSSSAQAALSCHYLIQPCSFTLLAFRLRGYWPLPASVLFGLLAQ